MAEVKIIKNDKGEDIIDIHPDLKDSKVAEKFAIAYFENMVKVKIEEQITKRLENQIAAVNERRYFYAFLGLIILLMTMVYVGFCPKKSEQYLDDTNMTNKFSYECNCSNKTK